jgi:hypothetical protein
MAACALSARRVIAESARLAGIVTRGDDDDLLERGHVHDKAMADSMCRLGVNFLPRKKRRTVRAPGLILIARKVQDRLCASAGTGRSPSLPARVD